MAQKNIIHIVVDAVRYYDSQQDERDKLKYYEKLRQQDDFICFEKMIVSAPSSVMSAITMFTGVHSYHLARNYNDFKMEPELYHTIVETVKDAGYNAYGVFNTREMREKFRCLFEYTPTAYLPKHAKLHQHKWLNTDLNHITENMINAGCFNHRPFYLMLWYNSRWDPKATDTVEEMMRILASQPFYDDTLIMLSADHGYPDQRRGLTSDGPDLKKAGLRHDCILTDDNVCVPFCIKFPKEQMPALDQNQRDRLYQTPISQQTILPTQLRSLGLSLNKSKRFEPKGDDLFSLINGQEYEKWEEKISRSDARFIFQPDRISSLRDSTHKYIYSHESKTELFYDLKQDDFEEHDLSHDPDYEDTISRYRQVFIDQENEYLQAWHEIIHQNLEAKLKANRQFQEIVSQFDSLNLVFSGKSIFIVPLWRYFSSVFHQCNIIVTQPNMAKTIKTYLPEAKVLKQGDEDLQNNTIIIIDDLRDYELLLQTQQVRVNSPLIIDIYFNVHNSLRKVVWSAKKRSILSPFISMSIRRELYYKEPMTFFLDIRRLIFNRFLSKNPGA